MQPEEKVTDADKFPYPELEDLKGDVRRLVYYACVEYFMPDDVIALLKAHDKDAVLRYLIHKVNYNIAINYKSYEIAAKVLLSTAREWIRYEWGGRKENELWGFAEAVCACLDFDEAFHMLTGELELLDSNRQGEKVGTLIYLRNSRVSDWKEAISTRVVSVSNDWGVLAASSQFDWQRADKWLTIGRPLSLIAPDALHYCTTKEGERAKQPYMFSIHPPALTQQPASSVIVTRLGEYLLIDNKPRTRMVVENIKRNLSKWVEMDLK